MSETLDMHRLKAEHMLKRARLAALGESFVILTLLVWLSLEYQNNFYMQEWVAAHFWPAQWLLNGTLVGVAAGLMAGSGVASWVGKKIKERKTPDALPNLESKKENRSRLRRAPATGMAFLSANHVPAFLSES